MGQFAKLIQHFRCLFELNSEVELATHHYYIFSPNYTEGRWMALTGVALTGVAGFILYTHRYTELNKKSHEIKDVRGTKLSFLLQKFLIDDTYVLNSTYDPW